MVENTHQAIIDREDWLTVQQLVHARHKVPHQISYTVLYQNILERIQQLTKAVENDEEFYALVKIKTADNLPPDSVQKEKYSLEKRMAELSGKVRKLFDGHADGIIDDRNYEMLMKDIQAEQESLNQKLSALQSRISEQHNTDISIEQFRETVRECLNVAELTPFILNKLISKIEISCLETVNGQKQQEVSVEWKFS